LDKNVTSDWESKYNSLTQSVKDLQKDFLTAGVGEKNNNKYLNTRAREDANLLSLFLYN